MFILQQCCDIHAQLIASPSISLQLKHVKERLEILGLHTEMALASQCLNDQPKKSSLKLSSFLIHPTGTCFQFQISKFMCQLSIVMRGLERGAFQQPSLEIWCFLLGANWHHLVRFFSLPQWDLPVVLKACQGGCSSPLGRYCPSKKNSCFGSPEAYQNPSLTILA